MRNTRRFLAASLCSLSFLSLISARAAAPTAVRISGERRLAFNDGWRFFKGEAAGAERPDFQDSNWNELRLPHEALSSRWYPGAGIYRNVWLDVTGAVSVGRWGTYITTPEVSDDNGIVSVKTELRNRTNQEARMTLQTSILDASGKTVAKSG